MIFDKFLNHRNLDLDIVLDKANYMGGDHVTGALTITAKEDFKLRGLRLITEGIEKTEIHVQRSSSSSNHASTTMTASNTFYFQDLSSVLIDINKNVVMDENKPSVMVSKGIREIPFEFDIPNDAYPSYKGRCAKITYGVKATADRDNWIDKNKTTDFIVHNSNHQYIPSSNNENDDSTYFLTDSKSRRSSDLQFRISGIDIDLGKMIRNSVNYRGKYIEQSMGTSIEFVSDQRNLDHESSNIEMKNNNNFSFSPGETIKGKLMIDSNSLKKNPNAVEISLFGIEYAYAQGYSRINEIEEHPLAKVTESSQLNEHGETNSRRDNIGQPRMMNIDSIDTYIIPFEMDVPQVTNKSYVGKYSDFFWVFDAKINIPFSKDLHCRSMIYIT